MDDFLLVTPINTSFIKPAQGMEMAIDQYKHNYSIGSSTSMSYQIMDYLYSYGSWPIPPPYTHTQRGNILDKFCHGKWSFLQISDFSLYQKY